MDKNPLLASALKAVEGNIHPDSAGVYLSRKQRDALAEYIKGLEAVIEVERPGSEAVWRR